MRITLTRERRDPARLAPVLLAARQGGDAAWRALCWQLAPLLISLADSLAVEEPGDFVSLLSLVVLEGGASLLEIEDRLRDRWRASRASDATRARREEAWSDACLEHTAPREAPPRWLAGLTEDEQKLLLLVVIEERDLGDAADRLGIKREAAKKRWQALQIKLQKRLADD